MTAPLDARLSATADCPCGSGLPFGRCCRPYLEGAPAPTAEALMRSRYTAFAVRDEDHLFRTWSPRTRPAGPLLAAPGLRWTGLEIREVARGGEGDDDGIVAFRAHFIDEDGVPGSMDERSRFERRAGRWFYVAAL